MSVYGDHGVLGYADRDLVFGDAFAPKKPNEAVRIQKANNGTNGTHVVPVYDEDGKTQIDTFTVGGT